MTNTQTYIQVEGCLLEQMDDDSLLYNPHNTTTLHLNSSSALVWQLCDGDSSVADIIDSLQKTFPQQSTQIAEDVLAAISELHSKGALREVNT